MQQGQFASADDQAGGRGPWIDGRSVEAARAALLDELEAADLRPAEQNDKAADEWGASKLPEGGSPPISAPRVGLTPDLWLEQRLEYLAQENARLREQLLRAQDDGQRALRMLQEALGSLQRSFIPDDPGLAAELGAHDEDGSPR